MRYTLPALTMSSVNIPREETSSEFEERFSAMASSAYTVLGVALGSRLGLFREMALMEEPWTPLELAEAGNWKERWVSVQPDHKQFLTG